MSKIQMQETSLATIRRDIKEVEREMSVRSGLVLVWYLDDDTSW
jgi:DeoR/GlpR family transcriptional regulator of sugar metabolism